jgi:hypothetical protein
MTTASDFDRRLPQDCLEIHHLYIIVQDTLDAQDALWVNNGWAELF